MRVCRIILALCMVSTAGCESVKMAVPADVAEASEELPITGRSRFGGMPGVDASFKMGSYEITDVDRDSQFGISGSLPGFSHGHVAGGYSYLFRGGHEERRGECAFTGDKMAILFVGQSWGTLGCVCQGSEGESNFTLPLKYEMVPGKSDRELQLMPGTKYRGQLQAGGRDFTIEVIAEIWSKGWAYEDGEWKRGFAMHHLEPTGCRVDGDGPAGGLELLHPGRVWLARSLKSAEREDMACLLGGLSLYDPPSEGH